MTDEAETPGAPDPRGAEPLTPSVQAYRYLWDLATDIDDGTTYYDHEDVRQLREIAMLLKSLVVEARAEPVWSREVPTVEGSYWVRRRIGGPWVSYFSQADLEDRIRSPRSYLGLEFAGPLTPPAELGEARP